MSSINNLNIRIQYQDSEGAPHLQDVRNIGSALAVLKELAALQASDELGCTDTQDLIKSEGCE